MDTPSNRPFRVRMAPSPTGELHIGGLRSSLYDYLIARQSGGTFILRIEDTDQARFVEGSVERIVESLEWAGIPPDEGVYLDERGKLTEKGSYGPYIQSQRLHIYREYADKLLESGHAYRCFCTPELLTEMREAQQAKGEIPRYDGRCRSIPREQAEERAKAEPHTLRHAMPREGQVSFDDAVRGSISFNYADVEDYVLMKSDGKFPTYQLANVIDDHLMEIDLVLRGEEWISSTPKNLALYAALGWQPPRYAHLPVILGPDGKKKLSKRDGDVSVLSYRDRGYLPEALINFLAFLGWSPGTEEEFLSLEELTQKFRIDKVQKAAAACNFERLDYVNGWYVRQLPVGQLTELMKPWWEKAGIDVSGYAPDYLENVAKAVQERLKRFDEVADLTRFFFERPTVNFDLLVPKKGDAETTGRILREAVDYLESVPEPWSHDEIKDMLMGWIAEKGYKNGDVLWPLRAGLTGEPASPGAFEMLAVLGKEEALARLQALAS